MTRDEMIQGITNDEILKRLHLIWCEFNLTGFKAPGLWVDAANTYFQLVSEGNKSPDDCYRAAMLEWMP